MRYSTFAHLSEKGAGYENGFTRQQKQDVDNVLAALYGTPAKWPKGKNDAQGQRCARAGQTADARGDSGRITFRKIGSRIFQAAAIVQMDENMSVCRNWRLCLAALLALFIYVRHVRLRLAGCKVRALQHLRSPLRKRGRVRKRIYQAAKAGRG